MFWHLKPGRFYLYLKNLLSHHMKRLLIALSCSSVFLAAQLHAQPYTEDTAVKFRINQLTGEADAGVDFLSPNSWNQYDTGSEPQWLNVADFTYAPWERPQAATNRIQLKMDESVANVNSAFGSADNYMNVNITGLYLSTLNIFSDFYIAENIWEDGGSTVRIGSTAKVSLGGDGTGVISVSNVEIEGTSAAERATYDGGFNMNGGDVRTVSISNANVSTVGDINIDTGNSNINRTVSVGSNVEYNFTTGGIRLGGGGATGGSARFEIAGDGNELNIANGIEFTDNGRSGGVSTFEVSGDGNTLNIAANGVRMGAKQATGGEAHFILGGNGNTLSVTGGIEWGDEGHSGGESIFTVQGKGNVVTSDGNVNIDGWSGDVSAGRVYSGGTNGIEIKGVGNRFASSSRIALGLGGDGAGLFYGGKSFFHIKSESAAAGDEAVLRTNNVNLGLGQKDGATESSYVSELVFGGNTRLEKYNEANEFVISVGHRGWGVESVTLDSGTARMVVENSNNVLDFDRLQVGSSGQRAGGDSIVEIGGSENTLTLSSELSVGSQRDGSTGGRAVLTLGGKDNTLSVTGGETSIGNADNSYKMYSEFIVTGTGNSFSTGNLKLGSGSAASDATDPNFVSKLVIDGSGNTISVSGTFWTWALPQPDFETAYDGGNFASGSWIIFQFDDGGVSLIDVASEALIGDAFILIDFTGVDSTTVAPEFLNETLISKGSVDASRIRALLADGTLAEAGESGAYGDYFELVNNSDGIVVNYHGTLIPEPAELAAIFGALALALAARRRRG